MSHVPHPTFLCWQERGSDAVPDDIGETTLHSCQGVHYQACLVPGRRLVSGEQTVIGGQREFRGIF